MKILTKNIKTSAIVISLVILTAGLVGYGVYASSPDAADSAEKNKEGVTSQGTVEAKSVDINSKLAGRISRILVNEGDEVKAGDVLVRMECEELLAKKEQAEAQLEAAKAGAEASRKEENAAEAAHDAAAGQVNAAQAVQQKAENGARKQEIAEAQAYYDLMVKTFARVDNLCKKGAVSEQKRDEVQTQLTLATEQLSIATEGARSEDKTAAEALVTQAQAMEQAALSKAEQAQAGVKAAQDKVNMAQGVLDEVNAYLEDSDIKAPIDGVVTSMSSDEGELVSTGLSIATISNLSDTWVEVKVKETDLSNIKLNQEVTVTIPVFNNKTYTGKVVTINQKPDFATKRATNDNGSFDIISYSVKIRLGNSSSEIKPGMTAFVQFGKG